MKAKPMLMNERLYRLTALIAGILAWLMLTDANTGALGLGVVFNVHGQMALWLMSVLGIAFGLGAGVGGIGRADAYWGVALFGGALIVRSVGLQDNLRVLVDELNTIGGILTLWERPEQNLLWAMSANIMPYPYPYVWLHDVGVSVFGRNLAGLRMMDAIMGALSVVATYGMMRHLATRHTAILAGLVLMSLPLHVHITRLALINMTDALLLPLLIWAMLVGLRSGGRDVGANRSAWLWAGVCLGLLQYFYEGGRLLSLPLVGGWLLMLALLGQMRRRDWRGVGWMMLMAGFVVFPLFFTWQQTGAPMAGRFNLTGGDGAYWASVLGARVGEGWLEVLAEQIMRGFGVYMFLPDVSGFYLGHTAMLLPFVAPFALMGVVSSVIWRAHWRVVLLLALVGMSLANGLFLLNSGVYSRYIGVTPMLACLVALGLEGWALLVRRMASKRAWRGAHGRARRWVVVMGWALVVGQTGYYFGLHLPMYNIDYRMARPYPDIDDAVLRASAQLPVGVQVHLVIPHTPTEGEDDTLLWALIGAGQGYGRDFMRFLRDDLTVVSVPSSQLAAYIEQLAPDVGHAFFVASDDTASARLIRANFSAIIIADTYDVRVPPQKAMRLYYIEGARSLVMDGVQEN